MARSDRTPAPATRLPRTIARADVAAIVERCREEVARTGADVDCEEIVDPKLPTVEVIARLALLARRNHRALRLEHAGPELLELLALCGLVPPIGRNTSTGASPRGGRAARTAGRSARYRGRT